MRVAKAIMSVVLLFSMYLHAGEPRELTGAEFYGLARDCRKLADIKPNLELWAITAERMPEQAAKTDIPLAITLISLVEKSEKRSSKYVGPFPEGTEIKMRLIRKPDGKIETVYYRDERVRNRLYLSPYSRSH